MAEHQEALVPTQPPAEAYALHSEKKLGLISTHENGGQEMGRQAARQILRAAMGRDLPLPTRPEDRLGVTFTHDDGSFDTGTRAVRNTARAMAGREPKVYKRTFHPIR